MHSSYVYSICISTSKWLASLNLKDLLRNVDERSMAKRFHFLPHNNVRSYISMWQLKKQKENGFSIILKLEFYKRYDI
jgi:hypothetical protein